VQKLEGEKRGEVKGNERGDRRKERVTSPKKNISVRSGIQTHD